MKPSTQLIQPPSIAVVLEDPDWTPEACASEQEIREAIVRAIRRKLHASGDLRDLRARNADVSFQWAEGLKAEAMVTLAWTMGTCCDAPREDSIHTDPQIPPWEHPHPYERTRAAVIGSSGATLMQPIYLMWWDAARDALRKLGV